MRRSFNGIARNLWFYSTTGGKHPRTAIIARDNYKVQYRGQVYREYLIVAECYCMNAKTNSLGKYFHFIKRARAINSGWYRKMMYVYEKKDSSAPTEGALSRDIYLPAARTVSMGMGHP